MEEKRKDAIELLSGDHKHKLEYISEFTGLSVNAVKKLSQMLKLYNRVDDIKLKEYLMDLKHDALLYSRFKTKEELTRAIEYVLATTNNKKIPRAKLKLLLEDFTAGNVAIKDIAPDVLSLKDKLLKLVEQIGILETKYPKDILSKIGIVAKKDLGEDHPYYFVLKHKISGPAKNELIEKGHIIYDPKTYYYYIPKVSFILANIDKITFGDRYIKPSNLDKDIVLDYVKSL